MTTRTANNGSRRRAARLDTFFGALVRAFLSFFQDYISALFFVVKNVSRYSNIVINSSLSFFFFFLNTQVDGSRQMYRAVMEEVSRFLEKAHRGFECLQAPPQAPIGRSKSVVQVSKNHDSDSTDCSTSYSPRARSSTNLVESAAANTATGTATTITATTHFKKRTHNANSSTSALHDSDSLNLVPPSSSLYTNFRDLTW